MPLSPAPEDRPFPVRRPEFGEQLDDIPRLFARDENLIVSHLLAFLSAVFPPGEQFFIRSVRAFRDQIDDPVLRRDVAAFIGQEAVHGREHAELNQRLAALGHRHEGAARQIDWLLRRLTERATPATALAVTAAVEHLTAVLGELLLDSELADMIEHEGVRRVFEWHALEECEHKSVCFDVYAGCIGDERRRVRAMRVVRTLFLLRCTAHTMVGVARDPEARQPGRLRRDWIEVRRSPLLSRATVEAVRQYDHPGFHPTNRDTDRLVAHARHRLFGEGISPEQATD